MYSGLRRCIIAAIRARRCHIPSPSLVDRLDLTLAGRRPISPSWKPARFSLGPSRAPPKITQMSDTRRVRAGLRYQCPVLRAREPGRKERDARRTQLRGANGADRTDERAGGEDVVRRGAPERARRARGVDAVRGAPGLAALQGPLPAGTLPCRPSVLVPDGLDRYLPRLCTGDGRPVRGN